MTGHIIQIKSGLKIDKHGKLVKAFRFHDASHKIRCRKSKKTRVVKRNVG